MARRIVIALFVLVSVSSFGEGIDLSAGVFWGFDGTFVSTSMFDSEVASKRLLMSVYGAYFDATFVRLEIDYMFNAGKPALTSLGENVEDRYVPDNYWITRLDVLLLGKYPFDLGSVTVWPAAGAQYGIVLIINEDGDVTNDLAANPDLELNDFFLLAGVGVDYTVERWTLSPSLIFALDLTPSDLVGQPPEYRYFRLDVRLTLCVGYRFPDVF
jgi:hypothetical protein